MPGMGESHVRLLPRLKNEHPGCNRGEVSGVARVKDLPKPTTTSLEEARPKPPASVEAQIEAQKKVLLEIGAFLGAVVGPGQKATSGIVNSVMPASAGKKKKSQRARSRGHRLNTRERQIIAVIKTHPDAKGPDYARELDRAGIEPPTVWIEEGCPRTYAEAYRNRKWATRIQNEKYRISRLMLKTKPRHSRPLVRDE
jgi:hypothetical protein